jgi:hypothetical protein
MKYESFTYLLNFTLFYKLIKEKFERKQLY